ncbi:phage baseplate assembly protein V [Undibacterium sp. TC9W]|uniref:phage baseplate assembly protein V n=1 Tax=Undibacterium sp. TC9W TaxID=3413053 RepID=UPI003BF298DC
MEFTLADLSRRLQNLVRFGTIAEVKHGRVPQVRLQIGDIKTGFLPMATARAGKTKTWNPPTVGEQCVLLSPSGEFAGGVVLPGIASNHNPAPDTNPDNTRTEYRTDQPGKVIIGLKGQLVRASKAFSLSLPVTVKA